MQELDFTIEASLQRWTEWHHFVCDGDSDSCCITCALNDHDLSKIIKEGYINIDLTLPVLDYDCFNGSTDMPPPHYSDVDEQGTAK